MKDLHIKAMNHNLHEVGLEEAMKVFERQIREKIGERVQIYIDAYHYDSYRVGICKELLSLINNKEV